MKKKVSKIYAVVNRKGIPQLKKLSNADYNEIKTVYQLLGKYLELQPKAAVEKRSRIDINIDDANQRKHLSDSLVEYDGKPVQRARA